MMKFCADTSYLDIECSILDIHQQFRAETEQLATKARRHEEAAAIAMTMVAVNAQQAAAAQLPTSAAAIASLIYCATK